MGPGTGLVARGSAAALLAVAWLAPAALAAPTPSPGASATAASPSPAASATAASPSASAVPTSVTASGVADGALQLGSTISVKTHTTDTHGWQHIDAIDVSLRLQGQPLDTVQVVPSAFSIAVVNGAAPVSIGEHGTLTGPYFRIDNSKVSVSAKGNDFDLTFPLRLAVEPPPGAVLSLTATDVIGVSSGDVNLSQPVQKDHQGFPWGTIGLAVAAALFIGGFVGNTFSTRRAKARPNVYATVARRIQDDKNRAKR